MDNMTSLNIKKMIHEHLNTIKDRYSVKKMLIDRTLVGSECSKRPNIYVFKHISRITYGRVPTKRINPVVT